LNSEKNRQMQVKKLAGRLEPISLHYLEPSSNDKVAGGITAYCPANFHLNGLMQE
jgi:hypothetical protein